MSVSKAPQSNSDSSRQPILPIKQASNSNTSMFPIKQTSNSDKGFISDPSNHPSGSNHSFGYAQQAFQNEKPSYQNDQPSFQQNGQPNFQNDQSFFQNSHPSRSFQNDQSSFQNYQPSFQNDQSSFQNDQPSFQNGQPPFKNDQPSFQNDQPSFHGDTAAKEADGDKKLKAEDSDPWKVGASPQLEETPDEKETSSTEMGLALSESLGTWATEFRDEVMLLKPSFQYQEDQDESIVTRAELLLRDTVQYREKLAAVKDQYSARLEQVSSSLFIRSQK